MANIPNPGVGVRGFPGANSPAQIASRMLEDLVRAHSNAKPDIGTGGKFPYAKVPKIPLPKAPVSTNNPVPMLQPKSMRLPRPGIPYLQLAEFMLAQVRPDPNYPETPAAAQIKLMYGWSSLGVCRDDGPINWYQDGFTPQDSPTWCLVNQAWGLLSGNTGMIPSGTMGRITFMGHPHDFFGSERWDTISSYYRPAPTTVDTPWPGIETGTVYDPAGLRPAPEGYRETGNGDPPRLPEPEAKAGPAPVIETVIEASPKAEPLAEPTITTNVPAPKWPGKSRDPERKFKLFVPGLLKKALVITELGDAVDCIWNALPSNVRRERHRKNGNYGTVNSPAERARRREEAHMKRTLVGYEKPQTLKTPGKGPGSTDHSKSIPLTDKMADILLHFPTLDQKHPKDPQGRTRGENAVECLALNEAKDRAIGAVGDRTRQANAALGKYGRTNFGTGPAF